MPPAARNASAARRDSVTGTTASISPCAIHTGRDPSRRARVAKASPLSTGTAGFEPGTFGHDVSEWGRLLSEISQHIASAAALEGQLSENEALTAIHEAYERGVLSPTGTRTGQIKRKVQH